MQPKKRSTALFRAMTHNMSWATQLDAAPYREEVTNLLASRNPPSEAAFVRLCRKSCAAPAMRGVSCCTANALKNISSVCPDILAVQEWTDRQSLSKRQVAEVCSAMSPHSPEDVAVRFSRPHLDGRARVALFWKTSVFGSGKRIAAARHFEQARYPAMAVRFDKTSLPERGRVICVVFHISHAYERNPWVFVEKIMSSIPSRRRTSVLLLGDSNHIATSSRETHIASASKPAASIEIAGRTFRTEVARTRGVSRARACCYPRRHYFGDYIAFADSVRSAAAHVEVGAVLRTGRQWVDVGSDHAPIVAVISESLYRHHPTRLEQPSRQRRRRPTAHVFSPTLRLENSSHREGSGAR